MTDRYIDPGYLWLVSIESTFSVDYRIQKLFLILFFISTELLRFKILGKIDWFQLLCSQFLYFCSFCSIMLSNWRILLKKVFRIKNLPFFQFNTNNYPKIINFSVDWVCLFPLHLERLPLFEGYQHYQD